MYAGVPTSNAESSAPQLYTYSPVQQVDLPPQYDVGGLDVTMNDFTVVSILQRSKLG